MSLEPLYAAVGRLFFYWSQLEKELAREVERLGASTTDTADVRSKGSFSKLAEKFRRRAAERFDRETHRAIEVDQLFDDLARLRLARYLIVHSISLASARPEDTEPFISCRKLGEDGTVPEQTIFTLSELRAVSEEVDQCRVRLRILMR